MSAQGILDFLRPEVDWRPPRMSELPSTWKGARRIAFDVETCDPQLKALGIGVRRDGWVCGYSFAIEDGPAFYLPLRHELGGNVADAHLAWEYLVDRMAEFDGTLVTNGGAYDMDYAMEGGGRGRPALGRGVVFNPNVKHRDTALDEALINEYAGKYDLDSMLVRHDLEPKDEDGLREAARAFGVDPKKELYKLPGTMVGRYGLRDVTGPLELSRKQDALIDEQNLWRAVQTESELLPVVVAMRRRGVPVNESRLAQFGEWATKKRNECLERFRVDAGLRTFSIEEFRSAQKFDAIVKKVTGRPLPRTAPTETNEDGNPSISEETLASIKHPAFTHLVESKGYDTAIKTFYNGTVKHLTRGRLHATFKQLVGEREGSNSNAKNSSGGTKFGRMSSSHTNAQNWPSPERNPEIGGRWRSVFVPEEGEEWCCFDYKQQEPRHVIHWANYLGLPGAAAALQMLIDDPTLDPYAPMVRDTGLERYQVKILYLAQTYNQGEVALCEALGLPLVRVMVNGRWKTQAGPEGRAIIDQFNQRAPYIKALREECARRAKERGYIILLDNRRCRFLRDKHGNVIDEGVGLNRLAQGGAGVQTKWALIALHKAGVPLMTVVHDETNISGSKWIKITKEIMGSVMETKVPMIADHGTGSDYAEASGYGTKKIDGVVHEFRPVAASNDNFMESFQWVPVAA